LCAFSHPLSSLWRSIEQNVTAADVSLRATDALLLLEAKLHTIGKRRCTDNFSDNLMSPSYREALVSARNALIFSTVNGG